MHYVGILNLVVRQHLAQFGKNIPAKIRKTAISACISVYTYKIDIHSSTAWQKSSYHFKQCLGQNRLLPQCTNTLDWDLNFSI
ncbi:hypothetical protein [Nostoc sp. NZL]|uniref:hypothetical protein n=1 Tax=Nostoc sp. NZL TaxID=2650612 RepID=UPI0018C5AB18|nr:hypothetical protein [Nostoc sp. NZL]MBG1242235.1 hypothetical protein [Nostoc sp. NZL]